MKSLLGVPQINIIQSIYYGLDFENVGVIVETTYVYDELVVNHYIRGRIINKGKKTTKSNAVVALFYDEQGNLIDYRKHSIFNYLTI